MSKVPFFVKPLAIAVALAGLMSACAVYVPGGPGPGYYRGGGYGYYGAPAPYYRGYYGRPYFR